MKKKHFDGFTLVELMVAVAIISLLVAIAIPQYVRFTARSKRSETYVILNAVHKIQYSYFSTNDQFMRTMPLAQTGTTTPLPPWFRDKLGLNSEPLTASGYYYTASYRPGPNSYGMRLSTDLITGNGATTLDEIAIGINSVETFACGCDEGVPFRFNDDITNEFCPC